MKDFVDINRLIDIKKIIWVLSLSIMIVVAGCSSGSSDQANVVQVGQQEEIEQGLEQGSEQGEQGGVGVVEKDSKHDQESALVNGAQQASTPKEEGMEMNSQQTPEQTSSSVTPSTTTTSSETKAQSLTEEQVAAKYKQELLRLQGYYSGQLQSLYNGAVAEVKAAPNSKKEIYAKYANKGRALEEESQAKINQLLAKMKAELQANQLPTTVVNQYRSTYYTQLKQAKTNAMAKLK